MEQAKDILPDLYRRGTDRDLEEWELVRAYWAEAVGRRIAMHTRLVRLKGQTWSSRSTMKLGVRRSTPSVAALSTASKPNFPIPWCKNSNFGRCCPSVDSRGRQTSRRRGHILDFASVPTVPSSPWQKSRGPRGGLLRSFGAK